MSLRSILAWICALSVFGSVVPETVISSESTYNELNIRSQMKILVDMFDQHQWRNRLGELDNGNCKKDMETYVGNLETNSTLWAAKMFDASGRYNGHFFFGNDFWLGSSSLCSELQDPKINSDIPPFFVGYFVAKVEINFKSNFTASARQIYLGLCLPKSCNNEDVSKLLVKEPGQTVLVNIINVRTVPGSYLLLQDPKFQIISISAMITISIIFVASVVEVLIKRKSNTTDVETEQNKGISVSKERIITKDDNPKNKNSFFLKALLAFSAISNGNNILTINQSKDVISCLHGLRVLSIGWIILVHSYLQVFGVARNKYVRTITERNFMYQTIANGTFSVDTFFFISGLLMTLGFFKSETSTLNSTDKARIRSFWSTCAKFGVMLTYRFMRLTPVYLFVLGVNEIVMRYIHNTSVFTPVIVDQVTCEQFWWRNALYINNFYPRAQMCMLWSWYIANDTQFFVIASVILLVAVRSAKHLKYAGISILVILVASWVSTFVVAVKFNYIARVQEPFALFDELYDKPWMRIGPYLIGMIIGYTLFKVKGKVILTLPVVVIGWILSLTCLAALVYGLGEQGLVVPASAFYVALGHTGWALSLSWITIACSSGYGGPFNTFFSCKFFLPLSRLTYVAYLVHPVLMFLTSFSLDGPFQIHNLITVVMFFGNAVLSFIIAFVVSLLFEAPAINLMKLIFSNR